MRQLTVKDIMTTDPVTVTSATPLKALADLLVEEKADAIPVLGPRGRVVGVVSQIHLVRKEELKLRPDSRRRVARSRRDDATAEQVGEVMTADPVTVRPDSTVAEAARLLDQGKTSCLPVLSEDGVLVGVVSPRDLLRVFLRLDEEIREQVIDEILVGYLGTNPAMVTVRVRDGVVQLTGELGTKSMLPIVRPAVLAIDGVIDVETRLTYAVDDTRTLPPADLTDY